MPGRRAFLRRAAALSAVGAVGAVGSTALGQSETLTVNDFGESYPGENTLGEWSTHRAFADSEVTAAGLRLEYDDAGWFASRVDRDVSGFDVLTLRMRGFEGGEETEIQLEVGGVEGSLAGLAEGSITRSYGTLTVDLADAGVEGTVDDVRLNFFRGGSGTVELSHVAFGPLDLGDGGDGGGPVGGGTDDEERLGSTVEEPEDGYPWEVEKGNEKEPENPIAAAEIDESTTVAELCPTFDSDAAHMYVPRDFLDYLPEAAESAEGLDPTEDVLSDAQKAAVYHVDLEAIRSKARSGELTLGELGTQAVDHARAYREAGMPVHAIAKVLPRLAFLPDGTEPLTWHKSPTGWDESAGFVEATNDPPTLIQSEWPTDARTYVPDEKYERDRAHDQPVQETGADWTAKSTLSDDYYYGEHALETAIREGEHPITGEPIDSGFTANAPMAAKVEMHVENSNRWYQSLILENRSLVPHYVDAAVIWWVGPMGLIDLRDGHYNNRQRPGPGKGHPQRDIVETVYDEERSLSAYAVRIAQHDEPFHMRTAYPNQRWSLEQAVTAQDPVTDEDRFTSTSERRELLETMLNTLHVELETNMDRNDDLMDELRLRNRMTN